MNCADCDGLLYDDVCCGEPYRACINPNCTEGLSNTNQLKAQSEWTADNQTFVDENFPEE